MDDQSLNEKTVEMHAIVHGNVQGVFFRYTTREFAKNLGITGTVKNKTDGTVEIFSQGTQRQLNQLLHLLESESGPGHIESISKTYRKPTQTFTDFSILYH